MKAHLRLALNMILLLFPLITAIFIFENFQNQLRKQNERIVSTTFYEKKMSLITTLNKLDSQQKKYPNWDAGITEDFLFAVNEQTDKEVGVYSRVLDATTFLPISVPRISSFENAPLEIFSPDNPEYENMCSKLKKNKTGQIETYVDGKKMIVYWQAYPISNIEYFFVVGIVPSIVITAIDVNEFSYGLIPLVFMMIVSLYVNIYLYNKRKKNEQ